MTTLLVFTFDVITDKNKAHQGTLVPKSAPPLRLKKIAKTHEKKTQELKTQIHWNTH